MAMAIQIATFFHQWWYGQNSVPIKVSDPLRIGILSSAMINAAGIIRPAQTHGEVVLSAIASRDLKTAQSQAKKYNIAHAFGSYDELLDSPLVDFVYISLPNGQHGEWAIKALERGKHVLLEKPFTANEAEAWRVVEAAQRTGKIVMEAFHWQCHPASHAFKDIVSKQGKILKTHAIMTSPVGSIPSSDIRWQFDLAGGALMDMTYVISSTRFALDAAAPERVVFAHARPSPWDARVDEAMEATLVFSKGGAEGKGGEYDVESTIYADMRRSNVAGVVPRIWELPTIEVETERAVITLYNFMMPHLYHYIAIKDKATGHTQYEKHYKNSGKTGERGEEYWSTYRWQLEVFVDKLRGREPAHWVTNQSSIDQIRSIDMVYQAAGLPLRPATGDVVKR
ncbi:NAD binding oxidoreductase [Daedalea quercina L-15889]|uniref:D-xylose 1-dehydrogenase (NADP(+), D-xylono-1,5-lactone-forming) n=1 Tax=Daedalea quercina L-15889 TaxID=1314783 RepID=A0A165KIM1_9APHY|nr:NAD binding oxidoreductase [Daedalea quercina L-15889]